MTINGHQWQRPNRSIVMQYRYFCPENPFKWYLYYQLSAAYNMPSIFTHCHSAPPLTFAPGANSLPYFHYIIILIRHLNITLIFIPETNVNHAIFFMTCVMISGMKQTLKRTWLASFFCENLHLRHLGEA